MAAVAVQPNEMEDTWESSALPPRQSVRSRVPRTGKVGVTGGSSASSVATAATPSRASPERHTRAKLVSLHMDNFKCFDNRTLSFSRSGYSCIVGPNSSGKSSILDAIKFVTCPQVKCPRGLVRRCWPAKLRCSVSAVFEADGAGKLSLRREVILDSRSKHRILQFAALGDAPLEEIAEAKYAEWIEKVIRWKESDVVLDQFSFLQESSVLRLLAQLPDAFRQLEINGDVRPPMLKRRCTKGSSGGSDSAVTGIRTAAESWVGRRLDELYCELTRAPLDAEYQTWGEGGQACLRKKDDGTYTIFVSEKRGLAAIGKGVPLESTSDGDRDLCALALTLILPGLRSGSNCLQDSLPPLVILDEPDSRLDKRAARCLHRLLSEHGQQCVLLSLNNHSAFTNLADVTALPEITVQPDEQGSGVQEDDPYGDRPLRRPTSTASFE